MLRWLAVFEVAMSRWGLALRLTGVGFFIGGAIVMGVAAGLWLDNKLNAGPILVIAGLLLGIVVAVFGVYQMLLPLMSDKNNGEND